MFSFLSEYITYIVFVILLDLPNMIKIFGSKPWMPVRISVKPCPYTIYSEVFVFPFITSLYVVKVWVESNWMGGFHSERHLHERVAAWN